jgi:HK97 family phage major capsid protein/HK97 family phage prohead protease
MKQFSEAEIRRAYSVVEFKGVEESDDAWRITGVATTPRVDRVGDIVESSGAKFALPLPLLLQHNSNMPVGQVIEAKASSKSIRFVAEIPKIKESGTLKDRVETLIQEIRYGLRSAVSIGFTALKDGVEFMEEGGVLYKLWEWLELSVVTIPANPDARITSLKSLDDELRAALGAHAAHRVVKLGTHKPGDSGQLKKGREMRTIKEQIASYEAKRQASAAALTELVNKSGEKGESMSAEEQEQFDTLEAEVKAIDAQIKRLKVADELNVQSTVTVKADEQDHGSKSRIPAGSGVRISSNLQPGIRFARMAMAVARAKSYGMGSTPEMMYRADARWMSSAPEVADVLKAAVNAGDTTTATWAAELAYAQNIAAEFIEFLRPQTIIGRVTGWRSVPFNVRVASQTSGSTGYWVGQGKPIPMSQMATSSVSLGIAKVAGMVSIDKELARLSTPSAEGLVRTDLARECQETLDLSLIDPNQGGQTNIQPASLTYAVTPVTPSGTNYAAFVTDVKSLFATAIAANLDISRATWVISPTTALALSLMVTSLGNPQFPGLTINGGTLMGLPVIVSQQALIAGSPQYSNIMVLLFPGEVFLADDGVANVEASDQVAIQMLDNPTNQSTATSTPTTMVSMFQTESIAVKAVRYINWAKARSQACAFIQAAAYA